MIRTQLYIPDDLYAAAKAQAALKGINISQYMRESLMAHIKVEGKKKAAAKAKMQPVSRSPVGNLIGKFSLGPGIVTHVALNHNDIYDEY